MKIILSDAPIKKNCMKYAKLFKRGYGSIEQIYRWSTTPNKELSDKRKEDSFIQQIKKVAKKLGLRVNSNSILIQNSFKQHESYFESMKVIEKERSKQEWI